MSEEKKDTFDVDHDEYFDESHDVSDDQPLPPPIEIGTQQMDFDTETTIIDSEEELKKKRIRKILIIVFAIILPIVLVIGGIVALVLALTGVMSVCLEDCALQCCDAWCGDCSDDCSNSCNNACSGACDNSCDSCGDSCGDSCSGSCSSSNNDTSVSSLERIHNLQNTVKWAIYSFLGIFF